MPKIKSHKSGFTIVEVTLVTAFVAMLLITITVILTQISAIFQKGLTIKAVNSVGRGLVSEFTGAINSAPSVDSISLCRTYLSSNTDTCLEDGAYRYLFQSQNGVELDNVTGLSNTIQYNGVFCTGNYSYLWNTHYGIQNGQTLTLQWRDTSGGTHMYNLENGRDFRLIRIEDKTYRACSVRVDPNYNVSESVHLIDVTDLANGTQNGIDAPVSGFLEDSNDVPLDLYEFTIFPPSQDSVTLRAFFAGTFILATQNGNINVTRTGDYCDMTGRQEDADDMESSNNIFDLGSKFNYCAINKFNFAARTAGSGI